VTIIASNEPWAPELDRMAKADVKRMLGDRYLSDEAMELARAVQQLAAVCGRFGINLKSVEVDHLGPPINYAATDRGLVVITCTGEVRITVPSPIGMLR
jgi:hypothetical protein